MKIKKKLKIFILIFILIIIFLTYPGFFIIIETDLNNYLHFFPPRNIFTLTYIHSVEKTPVVEYYKIKANGDLKLIKTQFESYGAGLPLETNNFVIKDGKFILSDMNIVISELKIRVARAAGQTIQISNNNYFFHDISVPGSVVKVKTVSLLKYTINLISLKK